MNEINNRIAQLSPAKRKLLEQRLQQKVKDTNRQPTIPPREKSEFALLSYAQERMWILDKLEPGNLAYNRPTNIRITGDLNIAVLEIAINEIVRRHEIFRTIFPTVDGQPIQVIAPSLTVNLPVVELSYLPINEQKIEVNRIAIEAAQQKFDLSQLPLIKAKLLHLSETENILLLTMHHIIFDGWSALILHQEIAAHYEAFLTGKQSHLLPLKIQYADFAIWQRQRLQGEVLESQLAYWKQRLSGSLPVLELPTDRPRSPVQTFRGAKQNLLLPKHLSESLKELSLRAEVTLFMTLLAAFQILLYRYTGEEDIIVGTPIAGRDRLETENLIGVFINTLVLRSHLDGNSTFRKFLNHVRQVALEAFAHQELPFEKLVEELQPERNLSHTPIFQVLFQLRNLPNATLTAAGITIEEYKFDREITAFDLTLDILETSQGLVCSFNYNRDLFDAATIERMAGHFEVLLEGIVTNPQQPIFQLPLLTEQERHQLLVEWNNTAANYPHNKCIHQLFEEQVERTPDALAVVFEDEKLTYRQLNNRANQLAHYLRSLGVCPEVLVGICVERSIEMIVGLLGILKAGGAYVPLDPNYPTERVEYILSNSEAQVLITSSQVLNYLPKSKIRIICLDTELKEIERENKGNPDSEVKSQNLSYVIYTSGSTGKPKGVQICHYSLVNFINSMSDEPGLTSSDRLLAITTICFDIHTLEIYLPLTVGATIILASREVTLNGVKLADQLANSGLSVMQATPATWQMLLNANWSGNPKLKAICGGETLPQPLANRLLEKVGSLWNIYGPTETTVWSTTSEVKTNRVNRHEDAAESIGRPIANTQIYILDKYLQPVPMGVPGELHIGGAGLARGYLNRPETTQEKFIPNPFSNEPGSRLYKTGDLARYLPDGNIEFLGRIDNQVKLRGFRIELGEIEAVLIQHPNIKESLVLAREDIPGDKRLVAYIVPTQEKVPTLDSLRHFLKQKLPNYMVPAAFVVLDAFPLTPNGKIDRLALSIANWTLKTATSEEYALPQSEYEFRLMQIWKKVLRVKDIGIRDNFFEWGGNSLKATEVIAQVEAKFGQNLPLSALLENPTIEQVARCLSQPEWADDERSLVAIKPQGSKRPFFYVHPRIGSVLLYANLARYFDADRPFYGLQSVGLDGKQEPLNRVEDMAAHYIREIQTVQPKGPYLLGGRCFGGRVALEMAQQLQAQGEKVAILAIVEAGTPQIGEQLSSEEQEMINQLNPIKAQGFLKVRESNDLAMRKYKASVYPGQIDYFLGEQTETETGSYPIRQAGWVELAGGGLVVHKIPGDHMTITQEPNVQVFAAKLSERLDEAEKPIFSSRLQEVKEDLERSRQLLTSIQARLKPFNQLSPKTPNTNHQIVPNLAFITCIEAGYLEAQSLLLYESIRRYGGRFSQCPIYAVSPRAGRNPSPQTKQRLEQLSVEYIDRVLNSELDFFTMANKSLACAYIEENQSHEILVWLDSDTLLFREPSKFWLPDYMDVAVRPINRKRNTTSGANDPFDDYWQKMCKACDVDYDSIPFLETFVDRCMIKACYNGGLVVVRPEKGIFRRWSENLKRGVRLGFDPRIDRCWHSDQPALSLAIWGATERVQILDPVYNYNIQAIDAEPQQANFYSSLPLVHIHYHQMFSAERLSKNPLLQPNFIWEDKLKQWLMQYIPLSG